jgi:hypothetical protein
MEDDSFLGALQNGVTEYYFMGKVVRQWSTSTHSLGPEVKSDNSFWSWRGRVRTQQDMQGL